MKNQIIKIKIYIIIFIIIIIYENFTDKQNQLINVIKKVNEYNSSYTAFQFVINGN